MHSDEETGQTIIAGMGELHLEIIVDRLLREFKVDANVGKPQVAYRETISKPVEKVEGRFVRQTGGRGQYGHVVINLEPNEPGEGFVFENKIVGGVIPREYIPAVDEGIQEAMRPACWPASRWSMSRSTLIDGTYHEVDSSDMAFKIAGSLAFKDAAQKAQPVLLEPVDERRGGDARPSSWATSWATSTPAAATSAAWSRAATRRSSVPRCRSRPCSATRPTLRSVTQGRATYTMQFKHYAEVPAAIAQRSSPRCEGSVSDSGQAGQVPCGRQLPVGASVVYTAVLWCRPGRPVPPS